MNQILLEYAFLNDAKLKVRELIKVWELITARM